MKYQSLIFIASCTKILAWVVVAIGVLSSIRLGIIATTPVASISFLFGGLLVTAIATLMLLAISRFIHLFVDMQKDVSELAELVKKETKE